MRADERRVDAEPGERAPHVVAEWIVPDLRHDGGPPAEPRGRNRNVRRAAAEHLAKGPDLRQRDADLLGVEVDRDAADRQHLEGHSAPETRA